MTTLFLVRHSANDYVQDGKLAGWLPDVHINAEGHQQAEQLACRMEKIKLDAIYASPLERAVETAQYLARPRGLNLWLREGLGELRLGAWQGQKIDDLSKTDEWRMFQVYPSGARPPGGETAGQMQARAVREVEAIIADFPSGSVAVVSHADPLKAIVAHYAGVHLDLFQRLVISPASVSVIWIGPWGPRLIRFNDSGPLDELKLPGEPTGKTEEKDGKELENATRSV